MTAKIFVLMVIACSGLSKAIPDNRSFPDPVFSRIDKVESIVIGNPANNSSTNCRLHIDYRNYVAASLKEVLQLAHRGKSAIRLNVWIESFNNKTKLTYVLPRLTWANEIGRTLISLIAAAENVPSMLLSSYTSTLNAGLVTLDIVVAEMTEGCVLLPGKNASDFVFSFLLHQLYPHDRVNDDHFDYKLCLWNKKTAYYTCCRLLGRVIICSDFSSITVLDYLTGVFVVALIAFILIVFPQMIMYISSFPKERTTYKISDSPMSLSSIFQTIFIDGHGPVKSLGRIRKLLISVLTLLTLFPKWDPNYPLNAITYFLLFLVLVICSSWVLFLLFFDIYNINKQDARIQFDHRNPKTSFLVREGFKRIIALPFNVKFWRKEARRNPFLRRHFKLSFDCTSTDEQSATNAQVTEHTRLLSREVESQDLDETRSDEKQDVSRFDVFKYCLSIVILLILYLIFVLPFVLYFAAGFFPLEILFKQYNSPSSQHKATTSSQALRLHNNYRHQISGNPSFSKRRDKKKDRNESKFNIVQFYAQFFGSVLTLLLILGSFMKCLVLLFYFIAGLYLNAGHYSTYFVPLSLVLVYSWSNWRSSVEAKYLELNTNIYKFSKKNSILHGCECTRPEIHSSDYESCDSFRSVTSSDVTHSFVIKLNKNGEPVIPKPLYDVVRETLLPYDEILVPFFAKVFLVVLFAYLLFLFLALSQSSGVSSNAKILTTMVATSIPFLFDVIWTKNSDAQKTANDLALESKLKRNLNVCSVNNVTGEILVEFIGDLPTDPLGDRTF